MNIIPSQIIPGIQVVSQDAPPEEPMLSIPISQLQSLTPEDIDPETGDGRKVTYALIAHMQKAYESLSPQDRPKSVDVRRQDALVGTNVRQSFTLNFTMSLNLDASSLMSESN